MPDSLPITTVPPRPQLSPALAACIAAIAVILTHLFGQSQVPHTSPVPGPDGGGQISPILPPKPAPDQGGDKPKPDDLITPSDDPGDPKAVITVKDSHGLPVNEEVGLGHQIVFSSEKSVHGKQSTSIVWTIEPSVQRTQSSDNSQVVVTPRRHTLSLEYSK